MRDVCVCNEWADWKRGNKFASAVFVLIIRKVLVKRSEADIFDLLSVENV